MKNIILLTGIFILACQDQPKNKITEENSTKTEFNESTEANWINLFDGKTFNGWHQYNKTEMSPAWSVEDGAMVFTPNGKKYGGGHNIVTDDEYTNSKFNSITDLLLYLASRSENIELIKKNYKKRIILIDRFVDSTLAYQHYGMGIDKKLITNINNFLLKGIKVDFTFVNTVNNKNLSVRLNKRKKLNRYDKFKNEFYKTM